MRRWVFRPPRPARTHARPGRSPAPARRPGPGPRQLESLVQRGHRRQGCGPAVATLRGVPAPPRGRSEPLLLAALPVGVPGSLLLGRGAHLRALSGPVHLSGLPPPPSGPPSRGRPHRRDRPGRPLARLSQSANRLPELPPGEDARVPPGVARPGRGARGARRPLRRDRMGRRVVSRLRARAALLTPHARLHGALRGEKTRQDYAPTRPRSAPTRARRWRFAASYAPWASASC